MNLADPEPGLPGLLPSTKPKRKPLSGKSSNVRRAPAAADVGTVRRSTHRSVPDGTSRVHVVRSSDPPETVRYTVCATGSGAPGRGAATVVVGLTMLRSVPTRAGSPSSAA